MFLYTLISYKIRMIQKNMIKIIIYKESIPISNTKLMCNVVFTRFSITKTNNLSINLNEVRKLWINTK